MTRHCTVLCGRPSLLTAETGCQTEEGGEVDDVAGPEPLSQGPLLPRPGRRTELTAEFQRLSVLLLRAGTGRRIGTALLTDARVQVT